MWRNLVIISILCLLSLLPVQAQENLLGNAKFEANYTGRGRGDFNFAEGWGGWFTEEPRSESWMNLPPNAFPHTSYFKYGGEAAQSISKGSGTFTAAAYQEVSGIPAGAILRGSAFVLIENAPDANARVRIGIGDNVGNNPFANITWSGWMTSLEEYRQITVDHTSAGGTVTLFIYATQDFPNDPNAVYFDDASLQIVGQGEVPSESGEEEASQPEPPRPSGVAFVSPQDTSANDGIEHTVQSGDTLASIATGYGVSMNEIMGLNGLDKTSVLQIGQVLTIATPDPNAPPEPTAAPTATPTIEPEVVEAEVQSEPVEEDISTEVVTEAPSVTQPLPTPASADDSSSGASPQIDPNFSASCSVTLTLTAPYLRLSCETSDTNRTEN